MKKLLEQGLMLEERRKVVLAWSTGMLGDVHGAALSLSGAILNDPDMWSIGDMRRMVGAFRRLVEVIERNGR